MKEYYLNLETIFRNRETTTISVVANNDTLSVSETERTVSELKNNNIQVRSVVWNRVDNPSGLPGFNLPGKAAPLCVPASGTPLTGLGSLNAYMDDWGVDAATLVGKVVHP
ncbi:MAG: ArsA family ATPase [Desulfobacteraceae bacterium]|nr:ArsA family ATPase [Desulfobacteraceae bacterium]